MGVVMTGMGADGSQGMKAIFEKRRHDGGTGRSILRCLWHAAHVRRNGDIEASDAVIAHGGRNFPRSLSSRNARPSTSHPLGTKSCRTVM